MSATESKLAKMGLRLPPVHPYPSPNRIPCVQVGNILFLGGHIKRLLAVPHAQGWATHHVYQIRRIKRHHFTRRQAAAIRR